MNVASGSAADEYASFASDYHWFFDDTALRLGTDVPGVRAVLARLPGGSRVLDAACGIGIDAAWLHRQGHSVVAVDASAAMIAVARRRLAEVGASDLELACGRWDDLAGRFEPASFDLVLCTGGAIAHVPDEPTMVAVLHTFRTLLRSGGTLVVDTHDWEVVRAGGGATVVDPVVVERDGVRCVREFAWRLPERSGMPVVFEPSVVRVDGDRAERRSYPITLWPFTRRELRERLASAGFVSIGLDAMPGDDRYTAVASAPT